MSGAREAQTRNGRPNKLTEWDRPVLKHIKILSSVAKTHYRVPKCLLKQRQHNNCLLGASWNGFLWRAATHKPKITMRNAKHWLEWCKSRVGLSGVIHHLAVRQTNLGLAIARRTLPAQILVPTVKFGGRGKKIWVCFSWFVLGPLVPVKGNLITF